MAKKQKSERRELTPKERSKRLSVYREKFNTQHSSTACLTPSKKFTSIPSVVRWPTGYPQLDLALGGGWPGGCLNEAIGGSGLGKTTIFLTAMGKAQWRMKEASCLAIAAPEGFDKFFGKMLGFHVSFSEEEIGWLEYKLQRKLDNKEKEWLRFQLGHVEFIQGKDHAAILDGILGVVKLNEYQIVLLDSIGALTSIHGEKDHDLDSVSDRAYGGIAYELTNFVNGYLGLMAWKDEYSEPYQTSVFAVNQKRDSLSKFISDKVPGGNALMHAKAISVKFFPPQASKIVVGTQQVGKIVGWRIVKGKHGTRDGIDGELHFMYVSRPDDFKTFQLENRTYGGFNYYMDLIQLALKTGVLVLSGTSHYYFPVWEQEKAEKPPVVYDKKEWEESGGTWVFYVNGITAIQNYLYQAPVVVEDMLTRVRLITGHQHWEKVVWIPKRDIAISPKKQKLKPKAKKKVAKKGKKKNGNT